MTDKEIIKALECCVNGEDCPNCPLQEQFADCKPMTGALDLINRQKAEIERYEKEHKENFDKWLILDERTKKRYAELYGEAKAVVRAEAVKELLDKIEKQAIPNEDDVYWVELDDIYDLVEEMVGEGK